MITEMPKNLKKWELTRIKGKSNFILMRGVLGWGLPMFVVMTFIVNRHQGMPLTPSRILVSIVIWSLGGALFGWLAWKLSEAKYSKFVASQKPE